MDGKGNWGGKGGEGGEKEILKVWEEGEGEFGGYWKGEWELW